MLLIQRLPSQCPHGMIWALIWVVGSALSLAYAQVTTEYACPTETVRPKKAIHAYCPEVTPKYSADNTSFTFPVEVVAGCPFLLSLNSGEQAFFKVQRPRPGMRISHNWDYTEGDANPVFYAFSQVPFYNSNSVNYYEQYFWSAGKTDERVFEEDSAAARDIYHCTSYACEFYCGSARPSARDCVGAEYPKENTGFFYFTMVGLTNAPTTSEHVMHVDQLDGTILPHQLQAVMDLYNHNCRPSQLQTPVFAENLHWTKAGHVSGAYSELSDWRFKSEFSTSGGERDMDVLPFCDWMYGLDVDAFPSNVSCADIPDITCDADGYVRTLSLSERGLRGALPESFAALSRLQRLYMSGNQLTGTLPASIMASGLLIDLQVSHNFLTGPIPCPTHPQNSLETLMVAQNFFSGSLPSCLFTDAPHLKQLNLNYNNLDSEIPPEIKYATNLVTLSADHTGLHGSLPAELGCLRRLSFLHLQRNNLTGTVPQRAMDGLVDIYSLRLSYNKLSGSVPHFDDRHSNLQIIHLDHNKFDGTFGEQLSEFANSQRYTGIVAEVMLGHNNLNGPLPHVFYNLLNNAFRITGLDAGGNHFVCNKETNDWPAWVFRTGSSYFGQCIPVATPTHFSNISVDGGGIPERISTVQLRESESSHIYMIAGSELVIHGENFEASAELKCRFDQDRQVLALYQSREQIVCRLPQDLEVGKAYDFSVANYGFDYWSAETSNNFVPVKVLVVAKANTGDDDSLPSWAVALIVIACVFAIGTTVFAAFLIMKELKGEPLFMRMEERGDVTQNPMVAKIWELEAAL